MTETDLTADEKVAAFIARSYRANGCNEHLLACPDLSARHIDGSDGLYGCDTGCEYARLEADMTCPHGESEEYEYGEFGDLADILAEIEDPALRYTLRPWRGPL